MMDRLLALKKTISEYFRQHPRNARKLTSHKWSVTNEVCSLLDDVSEATIRTKGAGDTHAGQAMFIVTEVIAMHKEAAVRACAGASIERGARGTCTRRRRGFRD